MIEACIVCQRLVPDNQLFRSPDNPDLLSIWKNVIRTEENDFFVCSFHFDESSMKKVLKSSAIPTIHPATADANIICCCCFKSLNNSIDKSIPKTKLKKLILKLLEFEIDSPSWICGDCNIKIQTFALFQLEVQEKKKYFEKIHQKLIVSESAPVFAEILITSSDPFNRENFVKEENAEGDKLQIDSEPAEISSEIKVEGLEEIKCLECEVRLPADDLMKHRIEVHLQEFICDICFETCRTKAELLKHIRRHFPLKSNKLSFVCENCEKIFSTKKQMLECLDSHLKSKSTTCEICQKTLKSNSIYGHMKLVHRKERDQICQICGKALKTSYDLKVHLRSHSGERPEICETCGKTFVSYAQLYKHRKIRHMTRENFQCSVCLKNLLSRSKLKCHAERFHPDGHDNGIRVDSGTNCYHCKICSLKFIAMHKYEKHLNLNDCKKYEGVAVVDDEKQTKGEFKCQECGSVLNTMKGLKKHIRFVHPKELKSCKICFKQLKNPHTLWQHMTLSHKQPVKKRKT